MEIKIINDTETRISLSNREIVLLGTAHISKESVDEVTSKIIEEKPNAVCVEIDEARFKTLREGQNWDNMNVTKILKEKKGFLLVANLVLSSFQKRMGVDVGVTPGEEMMAAIKVAEENNFPVVLADRNVHVTLRRAWAKSSFSGKSKLLGALLGSAFSKEELAAEDIEKLKERSALDNMMDELADYLPTVKEVLIDERDQYLASSIFNAKGEKILAVVGAGHVPGIIKTLEKLEQEAAAVDINAINVVPPTPKWKTALSIAIPVLILGGICALSFCFKGPEGIKDVSLGWFIGNALFSGLGALIALGNPISILVAAVAAPITSLGIPISSGVIAGIVEASIRKPRVSDLTNLTVDIQSAKGVYRNRVTRSLLVFLLASIGSLIGTYIGFPLFAALFGSN